MIKKKSYYVDLACPLGNVQTNGNQTPREKKPGCGDIPGPTGIPVRNAGGCPCTGTAIKNSMNITLKIICKTYLN